MRHLLLLLGLVGLIQPASADFTIINKPGKNVEVTSKLVPGKTNWVVFHADTYPVSRRMLSEYKALGERRSDLAILIVDILQLGSPLATKYKITAVPSVQIYDDKGKLLMEGIPGYNKTLETISSGR
jgi:hypothetical protein